MHIDIGLTGDLKTCAHRSVELTEAGVDGLFSFEGNSDVFFPLVLGAEAGTDLYTNVAIAFPRSPMHLAYQAWDLQRLSNGRFALGLGTQIKPHIERRFSTTWHRPVDHMVAVIAALRAIWDCWSGNAELDHHSEFYDIDLMSPVFVPPALPSEIPPIWAGALGPRMTRAMAAHADGIIIHPFNTGSFLRDRTLPLIGDGLESSGRRRGDLTLNVGCIVAPCETDEEYETATASIRSNLAFYASTPAYKVTLDHHGLGDLQPALRTMTKSGKWSELGSLINDEVLDLLAVRGEPAAVATRLHDEYGDVADRLSLTVHASTTSALAAMIEVSRTIRPDDPWPSPHRAGDQ